METTTSLESEPKHWQNPYHADIKDPLRNDAWPIPPNARTFMVEVTLELCGLGPDGTPLQRDHSPRTEKLTRRDKTAAMAILASLERNSLAYEKINAFTEPEASDARKAAEAFYHTLTTPAMVDEMCRLHREFPVPPKPPIEEQIKEAERDRDKLLLNERWTLSRAVRAGVIATAFELCGFSVGGDGEVEPIPEYDQPRSTRTTLAALRVLAMFDRLAIARHQFAARRKAWNLKHPRKVTPISSKEALEKIADLFNQASMEKYGVLIPTDALEP